MEGMIPANSDAPHRAIIWLKAEIHEVMKTGECTGMPVQKVAEFPIYFDGMDKFTTIRKLNELFEELKARCPGK